MYSLTINNYWQLVTLYCIQIFSSHVTRHTQCGDNILKEFPEQTVVAKRTTR